MADNNDKLSLNIASKDIVTATSGFSDVIVVPEITTRLTLNRQTVAFLNGGGNGGFTGTPISGHVNCGGSIVHGNCSLNGCGTGPSIELEGTNVCKK